MFGKALLIVVALSVVGCSGSATPSDASHVAGSGGSANSAAGTGGSANTAAGTSGESSTIAGANAAGMPNGEAGAGGVSNGGGSSSANTTIFPQGLEVSANVGNNSIFSVVALTLSQTASGPQLYAAVKNVGDGPGCNVSFSVSLYDKDEQTVGAGISGLMVRRFYQRMNDDGSTSLAGCVSPGDVTMVAIANLDMGDTPIEDVRKVVYSSQYWFLQGLVAIDGVTLDDVTAVSKADGVAYTGALVNHLDQALSNPTVAIYPLNDVGRPLGVAYGSAVLDVAPGASWNFETNIISNAGVGFDAYPLGGS